MSPVIGTEAPRGRLGRYHLLESLGGGPTGEVFRAKVYGVAGANQDFAVKRFHDTFVALAGAVESLRQAARNHANLQHPKIAAVKEFGDEGSFFVASEYIDGLDLTQLMDQGPIPLGTAAKLVVQSARAVGYAHGSGLLHLGVSPTNIICNESGDIKVTDFGYLPMRLPDDPSKDSSLGARMPYLAPEQLQGKKCSPATDVYQLGCVAFELMTGKKPYSQYRGEELANQIISGPLPNCDLPKAFQRFLHRALAKSPFERFPDAGAMADALEAALRSTPSPGSKVDAGKLVQERRAYLAKHKESEASGALSFPIPAPPPNAPLTLVEDEVDLSGADGPVYTPPGVPAITPPPEPPGFSAPLSPLGNLPPEDAETRVAPPSAEDLKSSMELTDPGLSKRNGPTGDISSSDLLLGPAGSDSGSSREVFIGGVEADIGVFEAETAVRPQKGANAPLPIQANTPLVSTPPPPLMEGGEDEDAETVVRPEVRLDTLAEDNLAELGELSESTSLGEEGNAHGLAEIEDEVSVLLPMPSDAPESVENPLLPMGGTSRKKMPESGGGVPQEVPPPLTDRSSGIRKPAIAATANKKSKTLPALLLATILGVGGFFAFQHFTHEESKDTPRLQGSAQKSQQKDPSSEEATEPTALTGSEEAVAANQTAEDASVDQVPKEETGQDAENDAGVGDAQEFDAHEPDARGAEDVAPSQGEEPLLAEKADAGSKKTATSEGLEILSKPSGAKVYIDGSFAGKTPLLLDASSDEHRLALLLPGHNLHLDEIDGSGTVEVNLSEVTPPGGPGGIKVRCKAKNRYYVFLDGNPVGELCPTERIGVNKGKHTIEIYDPVTDSRRAFPVNVKDTRLSVRVRVD